MHPQRIDELKHELKQIEMMEDTVIKAREVLGFQDWNPGGWIGSVDSSVCLGSALQLAAKGVSHDRFRHVGVSEIDTDLSRNPTAEFIRKNILHEDIPRYNDTGGRAPKQILRVLQQAYMMLDRKQQRLHEQVRALGEEHAETHGYEIVRATDQETSELWAEHFAKLRASRLTRKPSFFENSLDGFTELPCVGENCPEEVTL